MNAKKNFTNPTTLNHANRIARKFLKKITGDETIHIDCELLPFAPWKRGLKRVTPKEIALAVLRSRHWDLRYLRRLRSEIPPEKPRLFKYLARIKRCIATILDLLKTNPEVNVYGRYDCTPGGLIRTIAEGEFKIQIKYGHSILFLHDKNAPISYEQYAAEFAELVKRLKISGCDVYGEHSGMSVTRAGKKCSLQRAVEAQYAG